MLCPSIGSKWFWIVQIVLDWYKLFWSGPNHFGQVQIRLFTEYLIVIIWTCPKRFEPNQKDSYSTKIIWVVQTYFRQHGLGNCGLPQFWPSGYIFDWELYSCSPKKSLFRFQPFEEKCSRTIEGDLIKSFW